VKLLPPYTFLSPQNAYSAPPDPLAGKGGGAPGKGREGKEGEGWGGEGRGGE